MTVAHRAILFAQSGDSWIPALNKALQHCEIEAKEAFSPDQLLQFVDCFSPDCAVFLQTSAVDDRILRVAEQVRQIDRNCPLLIVTGSVSTEDVLRSMRAGVSDVLRSVTSTQAFAVTLESHFKGHGNPPHAQVAALRLINGSKLVGHCGSTEQLRKQILKLAATDANVLITGESGTGKELAAELIHRNSRVSARPFVAVNCAAIPEALLESELFGHERGAFTGANVARIGKLEHASGGTLFLDEVGDMSLMAQTKVLRAIESRIVQRLGSNVETPVQIRLLAATNQDLELLICEKKFRQDLYYRLNVVRLHLPPLRERAQDIPELTEHFLQEVSLRQHKPLCHFEANVIGLLQSHVWPGNVRELRNVVECNPCLCFFSVYWSFRRARICPAHLAVFFGAVWRRAVEDSLCAELIRVEPRQNSHSSSLLPYDALSQDG